MNLQLQDTQLVAKTHRTLNIFNFSCEQFLLKKIAQLLFPKTMESTTYLWVLFAPSVCGVLHQSSTSGFTAEQEADVLSLSPDAPVADRQKGLSKIFLGRLADYRKKTAGHGNNGTNQRFLLLLKMTWNVFVNLTNV